MLESSRVPLDYDAPPTGLSPDIERGLALVLREAVTNIARHAHAGAAQILFVRDGDQLEVTVVDDGVGGGDTDGNGLARMRERIARMRDTLAIDSRRRQGTRLRQRVALVSAEAGATPGADAAAREDSATARGARTSQLRN